jgi:hypothetical protein
MLNIQEVIAQTLSFTVAFTWRESIRDSIKYCIPEAWITGPIGSLIYAAIVTLVIVLIIIIIEHSRALYSKKIMTSTSTDQVVTT